MTTSDYSNYGRLKYSYDGSTTAPTTGTVGVNGCIDAYGRMIYCGASYHTIMNGCSTTNIRNKEVIYNPYTTGGCSTVW